MDVPDYSNASFDGDRPDFEAMEEALRAFCKDLDPEDEEDALIKILECEECPKCSTELLLLQVGGSKEFLINQGVFHEEAYDSIIGRSGGPLKNGASWYLWSRPYDRYGDCGSYIYRCLTCGMEWVVVKKLHDDWRLGGWDEETEAD